MSSNRANVVRQFGEGLSFGNAAELEALLRSGLGQGEYAKIRDALELQRKEWAKKNPYPSGAAEIVGSAIPGLVGAFIPGGQAGTVATVGRIARAVDAPLERLMARYSPAALQALQKRFAGRMAVGVGDEAINGALYSVGQAPTREEIPNQVEKDVLENMLISLGVRAGTEGVRSGVKFGVKKVRQRKAR